MNRKAATIFLSLACIAVAPAQDDRQTCADHLKAIGLAAWKYQEAHAYKLPVGQPGFFEVLEIDEAMLRCPMGQGTESDPSTTDYESWSTHRLSAGLIAKFGEILPLAWDADARHEGARNVLFADGHCETIPEDAFHERMAYFEDWGDLDWSGKRKKDPATRDWQGDWRGIAERFDSGRQALERGARGWRSLPEDDRSSELFQKAVADVTSGFRPYRFEVSRAQLLLEEWKKHLATEGLEKAEADTRIATQTADLARWRKEYNDGLSLYVEVERVVRGR